MLEIKWIKREGSQDNEPAVLDITSSPSTVYLRKNIILDSIEDENGDSHDVWHYEEAIISRADYEKEPAVFNEIAQLIEQQSIIESCNAEILLNQTDIQMQVDSQSETLAEILVNTI